MVKNVKTGDVLVHVCIRSSYVIPAVNMLVPADSSDALSRRRL